MAHKRTALNMNTSLERERHIAKRVVLGFLFLGFCVQCFSAGSQEVISGGVSLDEYLQRHGYNVTPEGSGSKDNYAIEGYSTDAQRQQFAELLTVHPHVTEVLEIGLNAGHSAEAFLKQCPNLKRLVSIDINWHPYTAHAVAYLSSMYRERFVFMAGDSLVKVPELASMHPEQKFDLIFIDGNHNYDYCFRDIVNARALARPNALILIDDYENPDVQRAIRKCRELRIIEVRHIHQSRDPQGFRSWVEARYL